MTTSRTLATLAVAAGAALARAQQPDTSAVSRSGEWEIRTSGSDTANTSTVTLVLPASAFLHIAADTARPRLVLRCRNGELSAYVAAGMLLEGGPDGNSAIELRFDNDTTETRQRWSGTMSWQSAFSPDPSRFVAQLLKTDSLRLGLHPADHDTVSAVFHVGRIGVAARRLIHSCPDNELSGIVGLDSTDADAYGEHEVETPATLVPGTMHLNYPEAMRKRNVEGAVLAKYVVDTMGRVEPGSIRFLRANDDSFKAAVRQALLGARFAPARIGDRKVKQRMLDPFDFHLQTEIMIQRIPPR